jgi:hypothetical protein
VSAKKVLRRASDVELAIESPSIGTVRVGQGARLKGQTRIMTVNRNYRDKWIRIEASEGVTRCDEIAYIKESPVTSFFRCDVPYPGGSRQLPTPLKPDRIRFLSPTFVLRHQICL